jgi:hypothetical protein
MSTNTPVYLPWTRVAGAVGAACAAVWLLCAPVEAENRDARQDRLEGLGKDELARIAPELTRGPVALVEFADMQADQLPAINIAVPVRASAELVTRILTDPASFPKFMPTLDKVNIVAKHDNSVVYEWSFDLALLHMHGRNTMTVYPPAKNKPDSGTRITIDSEEGDLGRGRMLFRVHPHGAESVLVMSMRLDLREANYVARQVAKAARSVNRSANIALAFSMALHTRSEAERRQGSALASSPSAPALHKPEVDVARLAPLLNRGDLLLFEARGSTLDQISVVGAVGQPAAKVRSVMGDAKAFGSALVPGSKAEVVSVVNGVTTFDWAISMPLLGVSGQMQLTEQGNEMTIDATDGAIKGGRWQFAVAPLSAEVTLITGWARFGFQDSSWLLEKLTNADPYLGHGIVGASELMLMRAIRSRAAK